MNLRPVITSLALPLVVACSADPREMGPRTDLGGPPDRSNDGVDPGGENSSGDEGAPSEGASGGGELADGADESPPNPDTPLAAPSDEAESGAGDPTADPAADSTTESSTDAPTADSDGPLACTREFSVPSFQELSDNPRMPDPFTFLDGTGGRSPPS